MSLNIYSKGDVVKDIVIGNKKIGFGKSPFVVAEMSGNHNQSLDEALRIVDAAAESGADALKIQTFTADTVTLDLDANEFFIDDPENLWKGSSRYQLLEKAHTPWEWHEAIFERCRQRGLIAFSSPFDETAVDFLESLNVPCYKIASYENIHLPLIRKVASTGKPLIISTGMANVAELDEMVSTARSAGCKDLVLLKCTSAYPAKPSEANLLTIPHMSKLFNCYVGLSDHTLGIGVSVAAVSLGAVFIEKHFILDRGQGGVDAAFSLDESEFKSLVVEVERAWMALGSVNYSVGCREKKARMDRRSLYISKDMEKGSLLTRDNLRIVRPGYGLHPRYFEQFLGKKINRNVKKGTPVNWDLV